MHFSKSNKIPYQIVSSILPHESLNFVVGSFTKLLLWFLFFFFHTFNRQAAINSKVILFILHTPFEMGIFQTSLSFIVLCVCVCLSYFSFTYEKLSLFKTLSQNANSYTIENKKKKPNQQKDVNVILSISLGAFTCFTLNKQHNKWVQYVT